MSSSREFFEALNSVAGVLIRCFFLGAALMLFWFVFYLIGGDFAYGIHSTWFDLSRHEFALVNYYGMAYLKINLFLLFLLPYVGIKMVLRKNKQP